MKIEKTDIDGVLVIEPDVYADERGSFSELFHEGHYQEILGLPASEHFVQDNFSISRKGTVRGLHYQAPPFGQGKLVSVLRGRVLDVAVDIRFGSPTFGQHVAVELSGENHKQLWIPQGFAHGFVVLEEDTFFLYKCTGVYSKEYERGILWNDEALGIEWGGGVPIVSEKDRELPLLKAVAQDFVFKR